jgi:ABC-2 type transport system permease protein
MTTLRRYIRLYTAFLTLSLSRGTVFRAAFFARFFMDIGFYIFDILFFLVVFSNTSALGGWTKEQVFVFLGCFLVVDAIQMTFSSSNLWAFSELVNKGDLDYYLTRPVSTLFCVSLREFSLSSFCNLCVAIGMLVWFVGQLPDSPSAMQLVVGGLLLVNGAVLYHLIRLVLLMPVFWIHSGRGLDNLFFTTIQLCERPDRIYGPLLRTLVITVLPFALMASYPARVILEPFDLSTVLYTLSVTAIFFGVALVLWRQALRAYSSASS